MHYYIKLLEITVMIRACIGEIVEENKKFGALEVHEYEMQHAAKNWRW